MTETSSLFPSQSAPQLLSSAPSNGSPTINGVTPEQYPPEDEESYTIKCICSFQDDDGHTVLCEKCEAWQHIICYYPDHNVPDTHHCVDCQPRTVDRQGATFRQIAHREQIDAGEKKAKRPTKGPKKKSREPSHVEQTNGWPLQDKYDSTLNSKDHARPAKRAKINHKPSHSLNNTPVLSPDHVRRAGSQPSPAKSPRNQNFWGPPMYSQKFLDLHKYDPGDAPIEGNLFSDISITGDLSSWLSDPDALSQELGKNPNDVFIGWDQLEGQHWPSVTKRSRTDNFAEGQPTWQYLEVEEAVSAGQPVGELRGQVGRLRDYCHDPANRWNETHHPEPFVFFHPCLPIYIDARREGSRLRYLRRSCRPNVGMKTVITNGREYHFVFHAITDIAPGTELTICWHLEPAILEHFGRANEKLTGKENIIPDAESDPACTWVSRTLAEFGGCACQGVDVCFLKNFDYRRHPDFFGKHNRKKSRAKLAMSPALTGPMNSNGRAGSEGIKFHDDEDGDSRSTSGSVRSKPQSRDLTPSETAPATEISDRERRKIAAAERTFERLEHSDKQPMPKKKKRNSGGSTVNTNAFVSLVSPNDSKLL